MYLLGEPEHLPERKEVLKTNRNMSTGYGPWLGIPTGHYLGTFENQK